MKKFTTQLFLLYCCALSIAWGSPSSIVKAGGFGGNIKIGKLIYSGNSGNLPALSVSRSYGEGLCYLKNENANVFDQKSKKMIYFPCVSTDPNHDNLYWNGEFGAINGGYSPENDTLYAADVITNLFHEWYGIPPLADKNGLQQPINFYLHKKVKNAFVDKGKIYLGSGGGHYDHPYTSLSVISYMVGLVFTEQHSRLSYFNSEQGGISIAFSCITAAAAEFYTAHKNSWAVANDVTRDNKIIHYMDKPSRNCGGKKPGDDCDIDTFAQYSVAVGPWGSSGLFNRAFYLLAITNGWNTRKAYDIFVQANRYHWNNKTGFHSGACDVVTSAKELGYDAKSVMIAFSGVGIDTRDC